MGVYEPIPEDLSAVENLDELETKALEAFDALRTEVKSDEDIANLEAIAADVDRINAEKASRETEAAERDAKLAELDSRIRPSAESDQGTDEGDDDADDTGTDGGDDDGENADADASGELVTASGSKKINPADQIRKGRRLNIPFDEVRKRAPQPEVAEPVASIVAAANVPGYPVGGKIDNIRQISEAAAARTRVMPTSGVAGMVQVASIERKFPHSLNPESTPEQVTAALKAATDPEVLVAAGGWCAPSLPIYDFFNIACAEGLLDLPTVNIQRGGIRFPLNGGPSISDVLDDIWLWTETNDILAVTGSGTKPCARPDCPTFDEERLECHGLCITAGNLTERAYPELIDNFIRLTMDAHAHVISQRHIAQLVAASTPVLMASGTATELSASWGLLNAIDLQVNDYKLKYRMCDGDILETVMPWWAKAVVRADIAKRNGYIDPFSVSDAEINGWFDMRGVRAQYVQDWQVGTSGFPGQATPVTNWPSTLQFLLFPTGTFVQGAGPTIDLGVTRDSTLNSKNDHTAAWTEECNLIAKMGHESRVVTVAIDTAGVSGLQADISDHP